MRCWSAGRRPATTRPKRWRRRHGEPPAADGPCRRRCRTILRTRGAGLSCAVGWRPGGGRARGVAGGVRLRGAPPPPPAEQGAPPAPPDDLEAMLVPYLPRALLGPLRAGHGEWLGGVGRGTVAVVYLAG